MIKKRADPLTFFLPKKRGGDGYWVMAAVAANGEPYSHAEIVHIISNADSSPRPLSSELFAQAVPALPARQPKAACRAGARINLPKISHA